MNRRQRFAAWVGMVVAILASPLWLVFGSPTGTPLIISGVQSLAALTIIFGLSQTTSIDVKRQWLQASAWTIVLGSMWLNAVSTGVAWSLLGVGFGALILVCVCIWLRHDRIWACVFILWHPIGYVGSRSVGIESLAGILQTIAIFSAFATAYMLATKSSPFWNWALWFLSLAATIGYLVMK